MKHAFSYLVIVFAAAVTAQAFGAEAYDLAVEDTMRRVRLDQPYSGPPAKPGALTIRPAEGSIKAMERSTPSLEVAAGGPRQVALSAAGGEAEGFQLLIMPKTTDLQSVTVTASVLSREDGGAHVIAAGRVSCHQVGYVQTSRPSYGVERTGWFADPLLKPEHFGVKNGDVQPVWVTVHVPRDTPGGDYTGTITVAPANAEPIAVRLKLHVWKFNIPRTGSLSLAFTWPEDGSRNIHGQTNWNAMGMHRKYMDMLLDHRIGPDNIYRSSPPVVEDVAHAIGRGATAFNLFNVGWPASYSDAQIADILKRIEAVWSDYEKAKVTDKAYVFGFDETYREQAIQQVYGAIGKRFPHLRRVVCTGPREAVFDDVDIWSMSVGTYWHFFYNQRETMQKLQQRGVEFWLYLSTAARPPIPNWWIESPLIEARNVVWHLYRVNADGMLYYFINHTVGRQTPIVETGDPRTSWNARSFITFNGDGHLIYAGQNGPLSSLRLANIRDGLEDFEYLKRLERLLIEKGQAADRAAASEIVNRDYVSYVVENFWIHTHTPGVLRTIRDRVARAIEDLSHGTP